MDGQSIIKISVQKVNSYLKGALQNNGLHD